jgi:hypothetical protein
LLSEVHGRVYNAQHVGHNARLVFSAFPSYKPTAKESGDLVSAKALHVFELITMYIALDISFSFRQQSHQKCVYLYPSQSYISVVEL